MDKPNKEAQKITGNEDVHNEAEQAKAAQSKKIATKKAEQAKAKTADKTPDGAKEATGALRQPINRGSKRRAVLAIETFDKAFKKFKLNDTSTNGTPDSTKRRASKHLCPNSLP